MDERVVLFYSIFICEAVYSTAVKPVSIRTKNEDPKAAYIDEL